MPPPPDIPPTPQAPGFMTAPPPSVVAIDAIASTKSNVVSQYKCKCNREEVAKKSLGIIERKISFLRLWMCKYRIYFNIVHDSRPLDIQIIS